MNRPLKTKIPKPIPSTLKYRFTGSITLPSIKSLIPLTTYATRVPSRHLVLKKNASQPGTGFVPVSIWVVVKGSKIAVAKYDIQSQNLQILSGHYGFADFQFKAFKTIPKP